MSAQKSLLYDVVAEWLVKQGMENTVENCEAAVAAIMDGGAE